MSRQSEAKMLASLGRIESRLFALARHLGVHGIGAAHLVDLPIREIMRRLNQADMKAAPKQQKDHPKPRHPPKRKG